MTIADHIVILPVLLPLLAGVVLTLIEDRHHTTKLVVNVVATVLLVAIAVLLLVRVGNGEGAVVDSYRLGNWPVPFAIVLVGDRLSAMMVMLTSVLALASITFSAARWHRAGSHFHTLFQLLLMGLNGAFLTGDLFNLFVFFEVLLAASYGLALHGSGTNRVKAGLHYVTINLAASSLFLIGVSLIYGVTGTLNMADLAVRLAQVRPEDRMLLEAGAAILGIAFLVKAGMWPLSFWLPTTYAAASPPVAAIFAIMSKVGLYAVLRLYLFFDEASGSPGFGAQWLFYGGLATIIFGTVGVLASQSLARVAGFSVLVSSGTILAMMGYQNVGVTAGALYYLANSTLALPCLFMLVELVERGRAAEAGILAVTLEAFGDDEEEPEHAEEIGIAVPATLAFLGISFACCAMLLAGMPPFSGFLAKFVMIDAMLGADAASGGGVPATTWWLMGLLIVSGLAAMITLMRNGINIFWVTLDNEVPRVRVVEIVPILLLLGLCLALTVFVAPTMGFMEAAAGYLHSSTSYVEAVLGPVAGGGA